MAEKNEETMQIYRNFTTCQNLSQVHSLRPRYSIPFDLPRVEYSRLNRGFGKEREVDDTKRARTFSAALASLLLARSP